MSYCRIKEGSDVYVYEDVAGGYTCSMCRLAPDTHRYHCARPLEMVQHLRKHIEAGHAVPARATEALRDEAEEQHARRPRPGDGCTRVHF